MVRVYLVGALGQDWALDHNQYWEKVTNAAAGPENEASDPQLLEKLVVGCSEYVKSIKATEYNVQQAFFAIYNLQDRSVLTYFLQAVEDPKIIRIIYEIDETEHANIGDPVGLMLAGNPHTPKDVLQKLSEIDFDEDYDDEQIQDALKQNPSARFLFS
jgi:hypothetical protein